MKMMPANRIEALRPMRSPSQPHRNEPSTVPVMPESGRYATGTSPAGLSGERSPYSCAMPGTTNASVVGFMTSIVTAIAITTSSPT